MYLTLVLTQLPPAPDAGWATIAERSGWPLAITLMLLPLFMLLVWNANRQAERRMDQMTKQNMGLTDKLLSLIETSTATVGELARAVEESRRDNSHSFERIETGTSALTAAV